MASFALPASADTVTPRIKTKAPAATNALAVAAPSAAQAPVASPAFGDIGFSGVNKPKPAPRPVVQAPSRSATRAPLSSRTPAFSGLLGIAASFEGTPYLYGGTTPDGFDCSGYTQYVFNKVGISLPRTAEQQRQFATPVSNPQPGDLVFFGAPAHHMGIYAGNGMMWDSPHTGSSVGYRAVYASDVTYGRV